MEESSEQILSHLAVIHRFMSTHIAGTDDLRGSTINIPGEMQRVRTISISDTEAGGGPGGNGGGGGGGGGAIVPLGLGAGLNLNSLQVRLNYISQQYQAHWDRKCHSELDIARTKK